MTSWPPLLFWEAELKNRDERLSQSPDNLDLLFERAIILGELGRAVEARDAYIYILTKSPKHFGALNNLGALLVSMDLSEAALITYREAIKHHPGNPKGHANLGDLLFKKGDLQGALTHCTAALQLDPDFKAAHQCLGYVYREMGDEEKARVHARKGFESNHTITVPFRGEGMPVVLVMLTSSLGGLIPIRQHLDDHVFHTTVVFAEFYDAETPLPPHQLIINGMGDADLCRPDFDAAVRLLAGTDAPVINHPDRVRLTGREDNAHRFSGIPGITVPRILTMSREALAADNAAEMLAQNGFHFPLLLRSPGFHTGRNFVRVDTPADLKAQLARLPGTRIMVIEYLDAVSNDGKIRKYRVMMIDGSFYPVHVAISTDWKVHYFSADMEDNADHRAEDERFLTRMEEVLGPSVMHSLGIIRDTLGLDYGGIDFSIGRGGELLFFEANATMIAFASPKDAKWDYRRAPMQKLSDAVRQMLTSRAAKVVAKTSVPALVPLLTSGGDARITLDRESGLNYYGCPPAPLTGALAYGSATASTISPEGFAAAEALRERLHQAAPLEMPAVTYARELGRIRTEITRLYGLERLAPDIVFAASGTDAHLLAAQLISPSLVVAVETTETGNGIHAALSGKHFSTCSAFAASLAKGTAIGTATDVVSIAGRNGDGTPREMAEIDTEVEALVSKGKRALLVVTDVSKTGLLLPSADCAKALKKRHGDKLEILVDACQLRLSQAALHAYLEQDFLIAITGSKFAGGPAFCGALLVPQPAATRLRARALPAALSAYSTRADWPDAWAARNMLPDGYNYGLLLRWEAAITELRAFHALPEADVAAFLRTFAHAVEQRLASDPAFEPLITPPLLRDVSQGWDTIRTIFPFLLRRAQPAGYLNRGETVVVYERLRGDNCYIGQPVACGKREDTAVSALRLCMDMRLVVDALTGRGADVVIAGALALLDRTATFIAR